MNLIFGFTNCSIDLVDDVCVVVVVIFNVVVVVVVVEGVLKLFSFLVLNNFELGFLERYPSFTSNNPKLHPKCNHERRQKRCILRVRRNHESDFETFPFMS